MRQISKSEPPASFISYRLSPAACYDGMSTMTKEQLRDSLLLEQGYLCGYCISRISAETMRIEHWSPQSSNPARELDYGNLLAACPGNEGMPPKLQHCDVRKGDRELKYNPAEPSRQIELRIRYLGDGTIRSDDQEFDDQLNDVLNLNYQERDGRLPNQPVPGRLVRNRKAVIDGVQELLGSRSGRRTRRQIQGIIERLTRPVDGKLPAYCAVTVYFLMKRLRAA